MRQVASNNAPTLETSQLGGKKKAVHVGRA